LGSELRHILRTGRAQRGSLPASYRHAQLTFTNSRELDITNARAIKRFVGQSGFDLIINCAGYTDVDGCETNQGLAYAVNAQGADNLAQTAQNMQATLVHLSTDYVFAGDDPIPRVESDPCEPQSVYGKSKLLGEQAVSRECTRHFIVRTAWLYGLTGKNFVKAILGRARSSEEIKVVHDQHGSPTAANDLAYELLRLALEKDYGIYHCTNDGACTWFDFAVEIIKKAGISCKVIPCLTTEFPRPARRPTYSVLNNARLRATIGDAMRPWQDALAEHLVLLEDASQEGAQKGGFRQGRETNTGQEAPQEDMPETGARP
jgi:dTDP-4-dehydrorhamnose reductase